jgi:hypothetical protein
MTKQPPEFDIKLYEKIVELIQDKDEDQVAIQCSTLLFHALDNNDKDNLEMTGTMTHAVTGQKRRYNLTMNILDEPNDESKIIHEANKAVSEAIEAFIKTLEDE